MLTVLPFQREETIKARWDEQAATETFQKGAKKKSASGTGEGDTLDRTRVERK